MNKRVTEHHLKVGDAVWVATALLHRDHPRSNSFPVERIKEQVELLHLTDRKSQSVYVHANQHCVANRPPNPARLKMLVETPDGGRKLYRVGDPAHPDRNGRIMPKEDDLPIEFRSLVRWYQTWTDKGRSVSASEDPLMKVRGLGREIWADESADAYVDRLRAETL